MIVSAPETFRQITQRICTLSPPPTLKPQRLRIYGTALVVECESPELAGIRSALIAATSHLIERSSLADEEWQRAAWWAGMVADDPQACLDQLGEARRLYAQAGSFPLLSSRHFRQGFLVGLLKKVNRATGDQKDKAMAAFDYFLTQGQPPWYASSKMFHTTIASGLQIADDEDRKRQLQEFTEFLWGSVASKLGAYQFNSLAIMGEDPTDEVELHFYDHVTDTFVNEKRPRFRVIHELKFAVPQILRR
jgi:hypothetical protein